MATERTDVDLQRKMMSESAAKNLEALRINSYPGRGIVMGIDESGKLGVQVYWITGRSENSRNRILGRKGKVVKTAFFDLSKAQDPALAIYNAMYEANGNHIVSNGDQTDTIAKFLEVGSTFEEALLTREPEPDAPRTPRISGIITLALGKPLSVKLSRIAIDPEHQDLVRHQTFDITNGLESGFGLAIQTYKEDGNPLPISYDEPYLVPLVGSVDEIAQSFWDTLNMDNKVALAVKTIDLTTGLVDFRRINKLGNKP